MKPECIEQTSNQRIVFSERNSKLTLINSDRVTVDKIKVDNCEITEGIRCDFLLLKAGIEHFIELKGQDIDHAKNQIIQTIQALSIDAKAQPKLSFIICTRIPMSSAKIQNMQLEFRKKFNSKLIIKSTPYEYDI